MTDAETKDFKQVKQSIHCKPVDVANGECVLKEERLCCLDTLLVEY